MDNRQYNNNQKKQTNILWFSMKRMSQFQFDSIRKKIKGYLNINQISKKINNIREIEEEIKNSEYIIIPNLKSFQLEKEFFNICQEFSKPLLRWKSENNDNTNSSGGWEEVKEIKSNKSIDEQIFSNNSESAKTILKPNEKSIFSKLLSIISSFLNFINSFTSKKGLK